MSAHGSIKRPLSPRRVSRLALSGLALAAVVLSATGLPRAADAADATPAQAATAQSATLSAAPAKAAKAAKAKKVGTTYYVSPKGSSAKLPSGVAAKSASVTSLEQVSQMQLNPGDKVLLKRGATYSGTLDIAHSGTSGRRIVVGSYGKGNSLPVVTGQCITVNGNYVLVTGVKVVNCPEAGIRVFGDNVMVRRTTVTGNWAGVEVMESASKTRIVRNQVVNNTRMAPNTNGDNDDNGAFGILIHGDNTEIAYNYIAGQVANSPDYGTDGSAVEIYGGIGTWVHDNKARDNKAFTELGNPRSANTLYENNVSVSSVPFSEFLVTRGAQDFFGPIGGTVARGNVVRNTGNGSQGFYCYGGCSASVMTITNNVFDISGRIGYADGPFGGSGNTYWGGGSMETPMLPGDKWANPNYSANQFAF